VQVLVLPGPSPGFRSRGEKAFSGDASNSRVVDIERLNCCSLQHLFFTAEICCLDLYFDISFL